MNFDAPVSELIAKIGEMQAEKIRLEGEYESMKLQFDRDIKQYKDKVFSARKKLKEVQFEADLSETQIVYKKPIRQHQFNVFDREIKIENSKTTAALQAAQQDYELTSKSLQDEIKSLLNQAKKKKKTLDTLISNIENLKQSNKSLKSDIKQLRSELDRVQADSHQKTDQISKYHEQNKKLTARAESIVNKRYKPKSQTVKIP
ncbi:Myh10 protein, putative [Trichomonas vaginalis G3]|uniref:Myh10 protein, putative n=1 Tax=Trichomonas vaginalis (strain ATCC PRA-98 / G3) TaxID=412133 RepID=A2EDJ0_TRIV3|nr:hypothetical protein TVAGG3_0905740 [Trichomonas vaginalis G3]EAY09255.1 Myh10 protein, putative [Trichomonas vaginalis G3]KAI5484037.1 hypothetical protein TVAGG3_0905740 [Trichomonas vaginalis G3]|eukprot:XP_001321478.1 Myh10 protein [Trichomonas vaginalis G3]